MSVIRWLTGFVVCHEGEWC